MKTKLTGSALVEVLFAGAVLMIILVPLVNLFATGLETSWFATRELRAQALLSESVEAIRSVREDDWLNLADGQYRLETTGGYWQLVDSPEPETIGPYRREISLSPVSRDETGTIVTAGGQPDSSTKLLTLTVSWRSLRDREISYHTYLTRYLDNLVWRQTTEAEFEQGEMELTKILDPPQADGEVVLEGGCASGSPESLIYDDQLRNGWRVNCSGLPFWQWLLCQLIQFFSNASIQLNSTAYKWNNSLYSIQLTLNPPGSGTWRSWARLYNFNGVCTMGFRAIHFYAYNPTASPITIDVTAVQDEWERQAVTIPAGGWHEISVDYEEAAGGYENNLTSIYFSKLMTAGQPSVNIYLDQIELTGGVGGYFTTGTLTSSVFDAGRETVFNRIGYEADLPVQTALGMQLATSTSPTGPWLFYGPGGTTIASDVYTDPAGEGIWLGNNQGRYCRYKAYLESFDGESSPVLESVLVNYAP